MSNLLEGKESYEEHYDYYGICRDDKAVEVVLCLNAELYDKIAWHVFHLNNISDFGHVDLVSYIHELVDIGIRHEVGV